jgi:hypothetical protein
VFGSSGSQDPVMLKLLGRKALPRRTGFAIRANYLSAGFSSEVSPGASSGASSRLLHRDVLIYDPAFTMAQWNETHENGKSTKHPHSGHVIAQYSSYLHDHSKYHFNNLGEYSMIFTSVIPFLYSPLPPVKAVPTHNILIHPDNLSISNITLEEIPLIMDLIMKEDLITITNLKELLSGECQIETLPELIIIAASNKNCTLNKAKEVSARV